MSFEAMSWAYHLKLESPATKLVLMALASYAGENGDAFPSRKTLCSRTCLSSSAVRNNLRILEEAGFVTIYPRQRENGSASSNLFILNIGTGIDLRIAEKEAFLATRREKTPPPLDPPPAGGPPPHRQEAHPPPGESPPPAGRKPTPPPGEIPPESPDGTDTEEGGEVLAHGVTKDAWDGFLEVRKKLGKPPTDRAVRVLFKTLGRMKAEGQDVNAVLEQSIVNEWAGVYPIKSGDRARTPQQSPRQPPPRPARQGKFDPVAFVNRNAVRKQEERDVSEY